MNKQARCSDEKVVFNLAENAEVTVLGIDSIDSLLNIGFHGSTGEFATARYMDAIGAEDVYYNINFNGRTENDLISGPRIKNYDIRDMWTDVAPLYKIDEEGHKVEYTKEDYEAENRRPINLYLRAKLIRGQSITNLLISTQRVMI